MISRIKDKRKYKNLNFFKIVNQLTYNENCNTSVSMMCNYVTSGLACSNSSSTCQCSDATKFWSQNKNACGKLNICSYFIRIILYHSDPLFYLFYKVSQLTYNETCSSSSQCYSNGGLICSNSSLACQCQNPLQYWSQSNNSCGETSL
jgi:hypothetical protein